MVQLYVLGYVVEVKNSMDYRALLNFTYFF